MTKTNAFSILCVFIRVFALWLVIATIAFIPVAFLSASRTHPDLQLSGALLLALVLPIGIAFVCYVFADKLAKLALARPQQVVFESEVSVSEWQTLAFSVVGLWQAIAGVIGLGNHLFGMLIVRALGMAEHTWYGWPPRFIEDLLQSGLQLVIGVALLFGARGLVGLIRRYREIGLANPSGETAHEETSDADAKPES